HPRAGASDPARSRPLAGDQRRGDLRYAAVVGMWRGANEGERRKIHGYAAAGLHEPGYPVHDEGERPLCHLLGLARNLCSHTVVERQFPGTGADDRRYQPARIVRAALVVAAGGPADHPGSDPAALRLRLYVQDHVERLARKRTMKFTDGN